MKKIILLLALFVMTACSQATKTGRIDCMKIVQEYMDSIYSAVSPVVIEVSELDSIYSPFNDLMHLKLRYSQIDLELSKLYSKLASAKTIRELDKIQEEALSYSKEVGMLDSLTRNVMMYCDHPELGKNRRAVKAKYTANGKEGEAYFFLNTSENTIGHSSMQNYSDLKDVIRMQIRVSSAMRDFE